MKAIKPTIMKAIKPLMKPHFMVHEATMTGFGGQFAELTFVHHYRRGVNGQVEVIIVGYMARLVRHDRHTPVMVKVLMRSTLEALRRAVARDMARHDKAAAP